MTIIHTFMKRSPLFSIVFVKVGVLFWTVGLAVLLGSPVVTLAAPIKLVPGKTYCSCACVTSAGNKELLWEKVAHCALNGRSCKADIGDQTVSGTLAGCQEFTEGKGDPTLAIEPPIVPLPPSVPGDLGQFLAATRLELAILKDELSTPDLVPLPTPGSIPPEGFCRRNDQGQLLVKVYNQGGAAAASKLRIIFGSANPADFDTPALAAGTGTDLVINIPNTCFDPNTLKCSFTLGVDALNAVAESNETNNNAAGLCGPQFQ